MARIGTARAGRLAATLLAGAALAAAGSPASQALTVPPAGSFTLVLLGNGHGHGMSQYGARGAAIAGLGARQIVAFYYPKTALVAADNRRIRVKLSGTGSGLTVAPASDLVVTGVDGPLPTTGVRRYRLVPDLGTGLSLQKLGTATGSTWTTLQTRLPNGASFHRTSFAAVRVYQPGGTSTDYYGFLAAYRNVASGATGGVFTVDRVSLDNYTAGVVPAEMPTSWQRAAVNAQAIAARTYGAYAMAHPQSTTYDICDTSWCQVYGGHAHYDSSGQLVSSDYPRAATATSNQILTYDGEAIFAQFSASNGGWSVDGGQPYLPAQQDPYDNSASGDPYLYYKRTVTSAQVAKYFGLKTVTQITVDRRDGNGTWNGRVLSGSVYGTNSSGSPVRMSESGFELASAFGVGTTWFVLRSTA